MLRQSVKRPRVTFGDRLPWVLYAKYVYVANCQLNRVGGAYVVTQEGDFLQGDPDVSESERQPCTNWSVLPRRGNVISHNKAS